MARSRDLFKKDRLQLRDLIQFWFLSLLVALALLALIFLLAPASLWHYGFVYGITIVIIDVVLLAITVLDVISKRNGGV